MARRAGLAAVDVEPLPWGSRFAVRSQRAGLLGKIELPIPGRHNVLNALAAVGVGLTLRIGWDVIAGALAGFKGVHRRFEPMGTWRGAAVVDDYAPPPPELTAPLHPPPPTLPPRRRP